MAETVARNSFTPIVAIFYVVIIGFKLKIMAAWKSIRKCGQFITNLLLI